MNEPTQRGDPAEAVESEAYHRECTIDEYHANPALGTSMMKAYADHPKLFHGRHVTGVAAPFKPTPSTINGTRVDAWLLERHLCLEIPSDVLGKNDARSTNSWKAWEADNAGFVHFTQKEIAVCERIEANIREHDDAATLLFGEGENQYSVFWKDEETGIDLKCRFDRVTPDAWVDIKTTKSLEDWALQKQIESLRYHWQDCHYSNGGFALKREERPFVFLFIHNNEPYEIATLELDATWLERGQQELRKTLNNIQLSKAVNHWLPPHYGRRLTMDQPAYKN